MTDRAEFDLALSVADLERIRERVFEHEAVFAEYLEEYHSSFSGYLSWCPNNIEDWTYRYYCRDMNDEDFDPNYRTQEEAIWPLLDFWLFAFPQYRPGWLCCDSENTEPPSLKTFEENCAEFDSEFDRALETLEGNGAVADCFELVPDDEADAVSVYETMGARSLTRMALYSIFLCVPRLTRHVPYVKNMSFCETDLDLFSLNRL